jgi:hypothetical protein
MAGAYRLAVEEGHFAGGDPDQFAYDLHGIMLAYHHAARLLRDPRAAERARSAFETLVAAARGGGRGPATGRPARPDKEAPRG